MDFEIPAELNPFMQDMLARGEYHNEGEVLIAGLRLLKSRELLLADVNAGIDQLEAGQTRTGEEVFARLERLAHEIAGHEPN